MFRRIMSMIFVFGLRVLFNTDNFPSTSKSQRFSIAIFADTENIRFVFAAVKDTILQSNLKEYNLV